MSKPLLACPDDSAEIRALADKCLALVRNLEYRAKFLTDAYVKESVLDFAARFRDLISEDMECLLRVMKGTLESDGPSYESVQPVETELGELERREKRRKADETGMMNHE